MINNWQIHIDIVDHHSGKTKVSTASPKFFPLSDVIKKSNTYDITNAKMEIAAALRNGAKRSNPPVAFNTVPNVAIFVAGAINKNALNW